MKKNIFIVIISTLSFLSLSFFSCEKLEDANLYVLSDLTYASTSFDITVGSEISTAPATLTPLDADAYIR